MRLFSSAPHLAPTPADPLAAEKMRSELLRKQKEFGEFLTDQLQEQASALLAFGDEMVSQPPVQMVAALAASALVQQLGWKAAIVYGTDGTSLRPFAAYPPALADNVAISLASNEDVLHSLKHGQIAVASKSGQVFKEVTASFGTEDAFGIPLQTSKGTVGYLLLAGPNEFQVLAQELAKELAKAVSMAATLAELAGQTQKLRELDVIRNSFISTTSHQLRTPLSVVKWMFSVFLTDPELLKMESQMQMIKQAYSGVERIVDVVNDLLNVSRIQDGRLPYTPQMADINQILKNVCDDLKPILESRKVTLEMDFDAEIPQFQFDAILVREAVQNLVNNAVDYNVEGGKVGIAAHVKDESFEIRVVNTGVGIKQEERGRMFTPMYRSADALLLHPDGSGLGLYLVKAIADSHGGTVSFDSNPGRETVFTFRIPLVPKS